MGRIEQWTKKGRALTREDAVNIILTVVLVIFVDAVADHFFGGSFVGLVITALAVITAAFVIRVVVTRARRSRTEPE